MLNYIATVFEALYFAIHMFRTFRTHQLTGGSFTYGMKHDQYQVPQVVMLLGTGREAWRVSDFAASYFAQRGYPGQGVLDPK